MPDLAQPRPAPLTASLLSVAMLAAVVMLASAVPVATRVAVLEFPVFSLGAVRFATAGGLLALMHALAFRGQGLTPIERGDWGRIVAAALLCVPINQSVFLQGTAHANASHAGLFYALSPVLMYLFNYVLGNAVFSRLMLGAAALAFCGAALLVVDGLGVGTTFLLGDTLLLLVVASWVSFSIVMLPLSRRYGSLRMLRLVLLLGSLMYSPVLLLDGWRVRPLEVSTAAWGALAFLTVGTALLNLLWMLVITRMDINRASIATNASPVISVVLAHLLLGEPLTRWLTLGALLVLGAIVLANSDRWRLAAARPQ